MAPSDQRPDRGQGRRIQRETPDDGLANFDPPSLPGTSQVVGKRQLRSGTASVAAKHVGKTVSSAAVDDNQNDLEIWRPGHRGLFQIGCYSGRTVSEPRRTATPGASTRNAMKANPADAEGLVLECVELYVPKKLEHL